MFEARFRQSSDSSYNLALRIKNFLIDDLRQSNKAESLTRMMDIAFNAKPNDCMFLTTLEFKPAKTEEASPMQNSSFLFSDLDKSSVWPNIDFWFAQISFSVTMDLRNLYICISFDFLFKLQDFFMSSLPTAQPNAESSNKTVEKSKINSLKFSTEKNKFSFRKFDADQTDRNEISMFDRETSSDSARRSTKPADKLFSSWRSLKLDLFWIRMQQLQSRNSRSRRSSTHHSDWITRRSVLKSD